MSVTEIILAHVNQKVPRDPTFRALLAHPTWWVPRPVGATVPTIIVTSLEEPPTIWAFSSEEAAQTAVTKLSAAAVGHIAVVPWLDDVLVEDDPRVARLIIDPASPIAFAIQTDALAAFRGLARAVRVERAMRGGDLPAVKKFDAYYIPYFGVLGQGHNLITLPSERGSVLAAFTSPDQVEAFLASGSEDNRKNVKLARVNGEQLFGVVGQVAQGVMVNAMGDRPIGLPLDVCDAIAKC
jgi:hypothetical protein